MQFERFYQKIRTKRRAIRRELARMVAYICYLETGVYEVPKVMFAKLSSKDFNESAQGLSVAYQSGLVSKETAVGILHDLDGVALDNELERIQEDEAVNTAITGANLATNLTTL